MNAAITPTSVLEHLPVLKNYVNEETINLRDYTQLWPIVLCAEIAKKIGKPIVYRYTTTPLGSQVHIRIAVCWFLGISYRFIFGHENHADLEAHPEPTRVRMLCEQLYTCLGAVGAIPPGISRLCARYELLRPVVLASLPWWEHLLEKLDEHTYSELKNDVPGQRPTSHQVLIEKVEKLKRYMCEWSIHFWTQSLRLRIPAYMSTTVLDNCFCPNTQLTNELFNEIYKASGLHRRRFVFREDKLKDTDPQNFRKLIVRELGARIPKPHSYCVAPLPQIIPFLENRSPVEMFQIEPTDYIDFSNGGADKKKVAKAAMTLEITVKNSDSKPVEKITEQKKEPRPQANTKSRQTNKHGLQDDVLVVDCSTEPRQGTSKGPSSDEVVILFDSTKDMPSKMKKQNEKKGNAEPNPRQIQPADESDVSRQNIVTIGGMDYLALPNTVCVYNIPEDGNEELLLTGLFALDPNFDGMFRLGGRIGKATDRIRPLRVEFIPGKSPDIKEINRKRNGQFKKFKPFSVKLLADYRRHYKPKPDGNSQRPSGHPAVNRINERKVEQDPKKSSAAGTSNSKPAAIDPKDKMESELESLKEKSRKLAARLEALKRLEKKQKDKKDIPAEATGSLTERTAPLKRPLLQRPDYQGASHDAPPRKTLLPTVQNTRQSAYTASSYGDNSSYAQAEYMSVSARSSSSHQDPPVTMNMDSFGAAQTASVSGWGLIGQLTSHTELHPSDVMATSVPSTSKSSLPEYSFKRVLDMGHGYKRHSPTHESRGSTDAPQNVMTASYHGAETNLQRPPPPVITESPEESESESDDEESISSEEDTTLVVDVSRQHHPPAPASTHDLLEEVQEELYARRSIAFVQNIAKSSQRTVEVSICGSDVYNCQLKLSGIPYMILGGTGTGPDAKKAESAAYDSFLLRVSNLGILPWQLVEAIKRDQVGKDIVVSALLPCVNYLVVLVKSPDFAIQLGEIEMWERSGAKYISASRPDQVAHVTRLLAMLQTYCNHHWSTSSVAVQLGALLAEVAETAASTNTGYSAVSPAYDAPASHYKRTRRSRSRSQGRYSRREHERTRSRSRGRSRRSSRSRSRSRHRSEQPQEDNVFKQLEEVEADIQRRNDEIDRQLALIESGGTLDVSKIMSMCKESSSTSRSRRDRASPKRDADYHRERRRNHNRQVSPWRERTTASSKTRNKGSVTQGRTRTRNSRSPARRTGNANRPRNKQDTARAQPPGQASLCLPDDAYRPISP